MRLRLLTLFGALLLGACAGRQVAGVCPDSAKVRCLTEKVCTPDKSRGCQVCSCRPPFDADRADDRRRDQR